MANKRDPDRRLLNVWVHKEFMEFLTKSAKQRRTSKSELARKALWDWYQKGAHEK